MQLFVTRNECFRLTLTWLWYHINERLYPHYKFKWENSGLRGLIEHLEEKQLLNEVLGFVLLKLRVLSFQHTTMPCYVRRRKGKILLPSNTELDKQEFK